MELVYLSKAAVDNLFSEVIPLHQEHVDLRSKAEAAVLQGSGTPHPTVPGVSPVDGPVSVKIECFLSTTPMQVVLPCQQINWALGKLGMDRGEKHAGGWETKRKKPFSRLQCNPGLAKEVAKVLCVQDSLVSGCLQLMLSAMTPLKGSIKALSHNYLRKFVAQTFYSDQSSVLTCLNAAEYLHSAGWGKTFSHSPAVRCAG